MRKGEIAQARLRDAGTEWLGSMAGTIGARGDENGPALDSKLWNALKK